MADEQYPTETLTHAWSGKIEECHPLCGTNSHAVITTMEMHESVTCKVCQALMGIGEPWGIEGYRRRRLADVEAAWVGPSQRRAGLFRDT
jgi:hypothetical protein